MTPRRRAEFAAAALLLLLAGWLRFYGLADNPPGLFRDEWEKGYTALSLWETGRHGIPGPGTVRPSRLFPLFIEVYEGHDRTSAVYQYISAPVVGLFGLGEWTARFAGAASGWLAVALAWLFARRLFGPVGGLMALGVAATHPAGLIFSRWAQQGIVVLPLAIAGAWCWWEACAAQERHRRALALGGGALLAVAAYAYAPARLVVPLVFGCLVLALGREPWRNGGWRDLLPGVLVFGAVAAALAVYTLGEGAARLARVAVTPAEEEAGVVRTVLGNYLAHFHPDFWLVTGDANSRHGLPANGFAGAGGVVLMLAGLAAGLLYGTPRQRRAVLFLGGWVLVAPAAAALTQDGIPHALRSILLVPPVALLAGGAAGLLEMARVRAMQAGGKAPLPYAVAAVVAGLLALDGVRAIDGTGRLRHSPAAAWQAGVLEAIRPGPGAPGGRVFISAEIPYANYAVLFAEQVPPARYFEEGPDAAETRIVPPGQAPELRAGDVFISPWTPRTVEDLALEAPPYVVRHAAGE